VRPPPITTPSCRATDNLVSLRKAQPDLAHNPDPEEEGPRPTTSPLHLAQIYYDAKDYLSVVKLLEEDSCESPLEIFFLYYAKILVPW
jgi:hypothetical protein